MSKIVAIGAGEKGHALCELWMLVGNHDASDDEGEAQNAEILVLGDGVRNVPPSLSATAAAKVIVDCSNPPDQEALAAATLPVQALARAYPSAGVVKAFNTVTPSALEYAASRPGPEIGDDYLSGFYCGDDAGAKQIVAGLISELNFEPVDCGQLSQTRSLEGLGLLVRQLESAYGPEFAISIVRRRTETSPMDRWM